VAAGKFDPGSALLFSCIEDTQFAVRVVARKDNANDSRLKKFVHIYEQSAVVRAQVKKSFGNNEKLYKLPWLSQ